jgi:hypothetical protein
MSDVVGWLATGVFAVSYFVQDPAVMRRVQALAAFLWMTYGLLIGAAPVIGANLLVMTLALYSSWRTTPAPSTGAAGGAAPAPTV